MEEKFKEAFASDLRNGLSQKQKRLYSKYFYDKTGDALFQEIMKVEEYYLTRSEYEILEMNKEAIADKFAGEGDAFQLLEFGAGDGMKTKVLLQQLLSDAVNFDYIPIDISGNVLKGLSKDLKENFPNLAVTPFEGTYFEALQALDSDKRKVILFLGSNIGNFVPEEALDFMSSMSSHLNKGDQVFIGIDLKKHPQIILNAYNDRRGFTKAFNLNLLKRINANFEANFELNAFDHFPTYDPISGETKSFLVSQKKQEVHLKALNLTVHFEAGETIFMEVSKKYDLQEIEELAHQSGFDLKGIYRDCKHYFSNTVWEKRDYESNLGK